MTFRRMTVDRLRRHSTRWRSERTCREKRNAENAMLSDPKKAGSVMKAVRTMKKLDIPALRETAAGANGTVL